MDGLGTLALLGRGARLEAAQPLLGLLVEEVGARLGARHPRGPVGHGQGEEDLDEDEDVLHDDEDAQRELHHLVPSHLAHLAVQLVVQRRRGVAQPLVHVARRDGRVGGEVPRARQPLDAADLGVAVVVALHARVDERLDHARGAVLAAVVGAVAAVVRREAGERVRLARAELVARLVALLREVGAARVLGQHGDQDARAQLVGREADQHHVDGDRHPREQREDVLPRADVLRAGVARAAQLE